LPTRVREDLSSGAPFASAPGRNGAAPSSAEGRRNPTPWIRIERRWQSGRARRPHQADPQLARSTMAGATRLRRFMQRPAGIRRNCDALGKKAGRMSVRVPISRLCSLARVSRGETRAPLNPENEVTGDI
jgi:hypothetical protein